jgi:hypothetical protein
LFWIPSHSNYRLTGPPWLTSSCTIESIAARTFPEVSL